MAFSIRRILLWFFVVNLGIALGAGLYESRIMLPLWLTYSPELGYQWDAEAVRQANTGLRFWVFASTVPLTLLTIANLIFAWQADGTTGRWWLLTAVVALLERVFTFSYFIPTMIKLMRDEIVPESKAVYIAMEWESMNYIRHALTLAAWFAGMKTLTLVKRASREIQYPTS